MKIGVIGLGVVGSAVCHGFKSFSKHEVLGYDIDSHKTKHPWDAVLTTDLVFVCVPTPTQNYIQKLGPLTSVLSMLQEQSYQGVVAIKSTVLPGTTNAMQEKYTTLKLVHQPEFLCAISAKEDFATQTSLIIGGPREHMQVVENAYRSTDFPCLSYVNTTLNPSMSELAKYIVNCFGAVKVEFFNELFDVCTSLNLNYTEAMALTFHATDYINSQYTLVPGPDGQYGFGGTCFPKDLAAFSHKFKNMSLAQVAFASNLARRSDLDKRIYKENQAEGEES